MTRQQVVDSICDWWLNSDKSEKSYNEQCEPIIKKKYSTAIKYLEDSDIQAKLKSDYQAKHIVKMLNLYDSMYQKALDGDVKSAEWLVKFSNSDFFEQKKNEIDKIIDNLKLD